MAAVSQQQQPQCSCVLCENVHLYGVGQRRVQHGEHRQVRAQVGHHTATQALGTQTRQSTGFSSAGDKNSTFHGVKTGDELMAASLVRPNIGCNVEPSHRVNTGA